MSWIFLTSIAVVGLYTSQKMEMNKEEFRKAFQEGIDTLLEGMAVNPRIEVDKFYNMACFLENIAFFSPVLYDTLSKSKKKGRKA